MSTAATGPTPVQLLPLDAATYVRHALHGEERAWPETNCYVDLWIELLHAFQLDPVACMGFTLAMDFEGDQWTFFKPSLSDLQTLYGVDTQELTIWRPLVDQVVEQVTRGRVVLVEVDAFHLPDTAGVSYRLEHTKTTIAIQAIDVKARTLGYFHNAAYFELSGDEFDGIFRLGAHAAPAGTLAPYTEFVKFDQLVHSTADELRARAVALLPTQLARKPAVNPVAQYRERFQRDIAWLTGQDIAVFHQYAFATLRQCGACAELAATFLRWLGERGEAGLEPAVTGFDTIANSAKALQFKVARAVRTGKPADVAELFDGMEAGWEQAMAVLVPRYGANAKANAHAHAG